MKKQIEVTVCDFCNKEVTTENVFGKDICRECFEKFTSTSMVSLQSEYSKTLTKEIKKIIKSENLNCTVEEFEYNVDDWYWISKYKRLSEEFIERFQDKVNWKNISKYQTLSEEFIEKFQDKVRWCYISKYQTLSEEFKKKWKHKQYSISRNNC